MLLTADEHVMWEFLLARFVQTTTSAKGRKSHLMKEYFPINAIFVCCYVSSTVLSLPSTHLHQFPTISLAHALSPCFPSLQTESKSFQQLAVTRVMDRLIDNLYCSFSETSYSNRTLSSTFLLKNAATDWSAIHLPIAVFSFEVDTQSVVLNLMNTQFCV